MFPDYKLSFNFAYLNKFRYTVFFNFNVLIFIKTIEMLSFCFYFTNCTKDE